MTKSFVLIALTCLTIQSFAQTPLQNGESRTIQSQVLKGPRTFELYLPEHFDQDSSDHVYPVLVVLEGRFSRVVSSMIAHLSASERMTEMIVVSFPSGSDIYYAPDLYANGMWGPNRKRLIFDADPELFSRFFAKELFPYLEKHFRAAPYRIILGTSATATYPLHVFWRSPELFQAHIAIAAGDMLGMGYAEGQSFIDQFEKHLKQIPKRQGNLYVGSADSDAPKDSATRTNLEAVTQRLGPYQTDRLKIKSEILPNQIHYDAVIPGLMSAIEMIFPMEKWSKDFRDHEALPGDVLDNIDAHYQKLSQEYGFTVLPPAVKWNSGSCLKGTGRRLLRAGKSADAVKVYERWTQYHPKSAEAKYRLATALEAEGLFGKAIKIQEKAVSLAKQERERYEEYLGKLKQSAANKN